jgi:hypothetical protein
VTDAAAVPKRAPPAKPGDRIAGVECGTPHRAQKGGHKPSLLFFCGPGLASRDACRPLVPPIQGD